MAFIEESKNGLVYMRSDRIGAQHAFTTRFGGVSTGDFASLNLGSNRGDDEENVTGELHPPLRPVWRGAG